MKQKSRAVSSVMKTTLLALLMFFSTCAPVFAYHELVTLTVKNPDPYTGNQSWFVYTKNPGDTIDDVATIKNYGGEPTYVRIYPVDAATTDSGSFILKFEHDDQNGVGEWTSVSKSEINIQPGERVDVPFTIKLPDSLPPGQYIGGIVIEYGENATQGETQACADKTNCGNSVIAVKTRIGSRIYITVPGQAQENVQLTDFSYFTTLTGESRFKFRIVNNGNVAYEPEATITVRDSKGQVYDSFTKTLGTSMPGTVTEPVVTWDKRLPLIANFGATASVTFPKRFQVAGENLHGAAMVKTTSVIIIPWDHIFYLSLIALIATCLCALHGMRLKKVIAESTACLVRENDDLLSVAARYKVSWKILARINRLKPPYVLKKGSTIHVPGHTKKTE